MSEVVGFDGSTFSAHPDNGATRVEQEFSLAGKNVLWYGGQDLAESMGNLGPLLHRPEVRQTYEFVNEIAGNNLANRIFNDPESVRSNQHDLQLAITAYNRASALVTRETHGELFENVGAVKGSSLGQYSAMREAGAIADDPTLFSLVKLRGQSTDEARINRPSGMVAALTSADDPRLAAVIEQFQDTEHPVEVALVNAPTVTMLATARHLLADILPGALSAAGIKFKTTDLQGFHSSYMADAIPGLTRVVQEFVRDGRIRNSVIPLIGNSSAQALTLAQHYAHELVRQMVSTVHWHKSVELGWEKQAGGVVEFGDKGTLLNMAASKRTGITGEKQDIVVDGVKVATSFKRAA